MGLDSVALVVDVEKHFDISIPNKEAERIYTVQDFADCVFNKVTVNPSQKCKSQILFYRFRTHFIDKLKSERNSFVPETKLKSLVPLNKLEKTWSDIEKEFNLRLPTLSTIDFYPTKEKENKIFGLKFWTRKTAVTEGTIGDLVNWTLSLNHERLMNTKNLCGIADIERIVIGIISESVGIPVDEIKLGHSITDDLGVD